jgi:ATP-dependent RNA helicase DHX29
VIDGNRLRFSVTDWKVMLALKILRTQLRAIIAQTYRSPGRAFSASQQRWLDIWQEMFTRNMTEKA